MRIAIFHELHQGGARRAVNELSGVFKKNHIVDLYVAVENLAPNEKKSYNKIFQYPFLVREWKGNNWIIRIYKDSIELVRLALVHKTIAKDIDKKKYDLVFVHPSQFTQAPFLLYFLNTQSIYYCQEPLRMVYEKGFQVVKQDVIRNTYDWINKKLRKYIDLICIKKATVVLANSNFTKTNIKRAYHINSRVAYLGVNTQVFKPNKATKSIDTLFLGSDDLLDQQDLYKKITGFLRGTHHIFNVKKEWQLTDKMLSDLYTRAKVVLALTKNEPFGLIPLEAMACGVPVIALNEGGYRETVQNNKTGFLVEPNSDEIRSKIELLQNDETTRKKMGLYARHYVETQWTWEQSAQKIEQVFFALTHHKK